MILLLLSIALAFGLGFSAHRASICTVAAVAEVLSSRTALTFLSFLKVILWVTLVNGLLALWMPELARPQTTDSLTLSALVGGFVFGVGAVINGGCSFSTISKIAQGNLHVALTLPSFVVGAVVSSKTVTRMGTDVSMPVPPLDDRLNLAVLLFLSIWGVWELVKIIRANVRGEGIWRGLVAGRYRLSTSAALIGIFSGILFAIHGRWAYSSKVVDVVIERPQLHTASTDLAIWLFCAVLAGAIASAISTREFSYSFAGDMWMRNVAGGFLMGFGAMMVPGGNAALLLQDLPALSLRAFAAYLSMVLGIAASLMILRRLKGESLTVSCASDLCTMSKHTAGRGSYGERFGGK